MNETNFTPGPWRIGDHGHEIISEKDIEGDIIADAPRDWEHSMENWPANAKLIAAAPDMLTELQTTHEFLIRLYSSISNRSMDFEATLQDLRDRMAKQLEIIGKATT